MLFACPFDQLPAGQPRFVVCNTHHSFGCSYIMLQAGASVEAADSQGRTPVDLVCSELRRLTADAAGCSTALLAWGSGANYQLGTGSTDLRQTPIRVDAFQVYTCTVLAPYTCPGSFV